MSAQVPESRDGFGGRNAASEPPPMAERSLRVALLLTATGGFLDSFTFIAHGHTFANSMTGNVVFLAISLASREWTHSIRMVLPIFGFLAGILLAYLSRLPGNRRLLPRPALACLMLEIVILAIVSILPASFPDMILVPIIAVAAAVQNTSFPSLESWNYNSVITTGNLRRFAESLYAGAIGGKQRTLTRETHVFGLICLGFFAGAAAGALATPRLHNLALWLPIVVLVAALGLCSFQSASKNTSHIT